MANYLLFDGVLNTQYLGLQAYLWLMLAMFIVGIFSYAIWYFFFWMPLDAVKGHFTSHIYKTNSAFTFDENLRFNLSSEKKSKLIFDMTVKEAKELQKDWDVAPCGLIGRVLNDLIFDGGQWTKLDSPVRAKIEEVAAVYNDGNPDDQIMTLGKFWKRLNEGKLGPQPDIPQYYTVPWKRIDMAIPRDHIQPMWDGYLRQLAREKEADTAGEYTMYGYLIIGVSGLICIAMLVMDFLK